MTTPIVPRIQVVVTGSLNAATLPRWRRLLDDAVAAMPAHLVVDLTGCADVDHAGTALLARCPRTDVGHRGTAHPPGHEPPARPGPAAGADTAGYRPKHRGGRRGPAAPVSTAAGRTAGATHAGPVPPPDPSPVRPGTRHEPTSVEGAACGLSRQGRLLSWRSPSPTRWTRNSVRRNLALIEKMIAMRPNLIIDLTRCSTVDQAGAALLTDVHRTVRDGGGQLTLRGLSMQLTCHCARRGWRRSSRPPTGHPATGRDTAEHGNAPGR